MQAARRKKQLVTRDITVPGNLQRACDDFNAGQFFDAHEHIEEIWQMERGPLRDCYKGLIQVAAAFVHLARGKYRGTERLLRTALGYMAPYREQGAMGFDIEAVCSSVERVHARLVEAGLSGAGSLDPGDRPVFEFDRAKLASEAVRWGAWGFDSDGEPLDMTITVAE